MEEEKEKQEEEEVAGKFLYKRIEEHVVNGISWKVEVVIVNMHVLHLFTMGQIISKPFI
jgi:hypothetical protein